MKKKKKRVEEVLSLSKLGFRIMAVITGVLIVCVGILCTSPSKATDDEPYIPPFISDDTDPIEDTTEETTAEEITTEPDTTVTVDTETDPDDTTDTPGTDTETGTVTETETTAAVTTTEPPVTTVPVTNPPETNPAEGKQNYREYNGRQYGDKETFVGEYKTDRVQIGVSKVVDGDLNYYICDIKVKSVYDFHTAFANNSIGGRLITSKLAASVGAGFAVNGDFCGFRNSGIIIREGKLYRNKKSDNWDLCYLNKYGDLIVCKNDKQDGKTLVNDGVYQSWCFGPTLVENYKAYTKGNFNTPDLSQSAREPRTAIGQIDELHYIILVVDAVRDPNGTGGWTTIGGMSFTELANTFVSLGCKTAYNLDGGASTALWLNGKLANNPAGSGERAVSDIIYFK